MLRTLIVLFWFPAVTFPQSDVHDVLEDIASTCRALYLRGYVVDITRGLTSEAHMELAHFGEDRPVLPKSDDLPKLDGTPLMPMFSTERAGTPVEEAALPLARIKQLIPLFVVTFLASCVVLDGFAIRTLGELQFGTLILVWICLYIAVILTDGMQTWLAWNELRRLLFFFDRLPLRRTLRALKGLAWGSHPRLRPSTASSSR